MEKKLKRSRVLEHHTSTLVFYCCAGGLARAGVPSDGLRSGRCESSCVLCCVSVSQQSLECCPTSQLGRSRAGSAVSRQVWRCPCCPGSCWSGSCVCWGTRSTSTGQYSAVERCVRCSAGCPWSAAGGGTRWRGFAGCDSSVSSASSTSVFLWQVGEMRMAGD